ncbi:amino acid adenylation domain-containing protein [Colletotrichum karsti]|uniref:Amino acid adenylation domain-containing protein n=1 Tax=Colletotrichum karsti TaxID=1095194 RepID=A0A9P6IG21_9PEZI|nr:amino acid adenylation domain-containing protein [Colletotrichum karsti]KAF9881769.1 amino acid adenylation domain-containing protein [Colletotrichum karsti]
MAVELVSLAEGFSCYTSSEIEAQFIYNEIWNDHCYDGPKVSETPFIIDAGANIGLFSIYMKQKYPNARIIAFEPAPDTFKTMQRNFELHKITGVETHQYGLGPRASTEKLTYYPTFPGNSTLRPETKLSTIEAVTERFGRDFAEARFGDAQVLDVEIQPLSKVLKDMSGVEKIDLLKIDVEGVELGVLQGLSDVQWNKLQNVALETTASSGDLEPIEELLKSKGLAVEREEAVFDDRGAHEFFVVRAYRESKEV